MWTRSVLKTPSAFFVASWEIQKKTHICQLNTECGTEVNVTLDMQFPSRVKAPIVFYGTDTKAVLIFSVQPRQECKQVPKMLDFFIKPIDLKHQFSAVRSSKRRQSHIGGSSY